MKFFTTFEDFLFEQKVAYKRKYTEAYPAKNISTVAKIRNTVLDAVADGIITEEEMEAILTDVHAHRKWMRKNKDLFKVITEDGVKKFRLSKKGLRIRNKLLELNEENNSVTESLSLSYDIIRQALLGNYITKKESNSKRVQDIARDTALYYDDLEEIGSSDMTFILKSFLDGIGKETYFDKRGILAVK